MTSERPKTPDLLLEQLALGELSAADERALRGQLSPEELDDAVTQLSRDDARFHAEHAADEMAASIRGRVRVAQARAAQQKQRARTWRFALPGAVAAACALLLVVRDAGNHGVDARPAAPKVEEPQEREKGIAPHLVLYRRVGEQAETLQEGTRAQKGDMLQVGYVSASARHGVIVSVDGNGSVTLHFPEGEGATTRLELKGEQLLGHAYELDDAPRFERFFFVTSQAPIDVRRVLSAARALATQPDLARHKALELSPPLKQNTLTLVKE